MRRYPFVQLDVFTHTPLEGNQLAVFPDARGLTTEEMQRLARETNLSETTFIVPRPAEVEAEDGVQVRIFTVQEELPFAGHPTLGSAWLLQQQRGGQQVVLDLKVGRIPVEFTERDGRLMGEMRQRDPEFGAVHAAEEVARPVGVPLADVDTSLPIQTVSTGMAFTMVPLRSLEAIGRLQVDARGAMEFAQTHGGKFFYFVTRQVVTGGATLHARMQFYNGEDPATGSAAGCCTAWAVRHGVLASEARGLIEQGLEIARPSFLHLRARRTADGATDVRVGGGVVETARGEYRLP